MSQSDYAIHPLKPQHLINSTHIPSMNEQVLVFVCTREITLVSLLQTVEVRTEQINSQFYIQ